jgi:hypothetical protein
MCLDNGVIYRLGDYIFVNPLIENGENEQDFIRFPWIAKIKKIHAGGKQLQINWMYHPHTLPAATKTFRGPYEIISTNHEDDIDLRSACGLAAVEENCDDCKTRDHWCFNTTFDFGMEKLDSQSPYKQRKRRDSRKLGFQSQYKRRKIE